MAQLNFAQREITAKIVYYGASKAGVSTNVEQLAAAVLPSRRSDVLTLTMPDSDLTVPCFEVVNDTHRAKDFPIRTTIYGVPGGADDAGIRREIMRNVDGVVFVADARPQRETANVESLLALERLLREDGVDLTEVPMVMQINHSDADNARTPQAVALDLNPYGFPVHTAIARSGKGVTETLQTIVGLVALRIGATLSGESSGVRMVALHEANPPDLKTRVAGQVQTLIEQAEEERVAADPVTQYGTLTPSLSVSVRYQSEDLRGTRPTQLLSAELVGEDIALDLVHERINGGQPRRIHVMVENRPSDVALLPQPQALISTTGSVTDALPDRIEIPPPLAPADDWPPIVYGFIGLACGLAMGLLLGVILFY